MQKVLQVSAGLGQGGAESMIMEIYEKIDKSRVQFDFLVYDDTPTHYTERVKELGGRVIVLDREKKWDIFGYKRKLKKIISQYGPYIAIHAHTDSHSAFPLLVAKTCGIKVRVCHSHTTKQREKTSAIRRCYRMVMRNIILNKATVLAACGAEAGYALYGKKVFTSNGVVIHNPVDIEAFLEKNSRRHTENGTITIGCVGSFREAKNHFFLVKLAALLKQKKISFKMQLVGTGELENDVKRQVNALNLQNEILFLGLRHDIPDLMASFDVLIMPSLYEGFPVTLVESQAGGIPALISDRITPEVDLGLGLIKRLSLDDSMEKWVNGIVECSKIISPDVEKRREVLIKKGFDTSSVINELYRIYGVK